MRLLRGATHQRRSMSHSAGRRLAILATKNVRCNGSLGHQIHAVSREEYLRLRPEAGKNTAKTLEENGVPQRSAGRKRSSRRASRKRRIKLCKRVCRWLRRRLGFWQAKGLHSCIRWLRTSTCSLWLTFPDTPVSARVVETVKNSPDAHAGGWCEDTMSLVQWIAQRLSATSHIPEVEFGLDVAQRISSSIVCDSARATFLSRVWRMTFSLTTLDLSGLIPIAHEGPSGRALLDIRSCCAPRGLPLAASAPPRGRPFVSSGSVS